MNEAQIFEPQNTDRRPYAQAYDPTVHAFRIREYLEEIDGPETRIELADQLGISVSSLYRFETTEIGEDRRNIKHLEIAAKFFSVKLKRKISIEDLITK